MAGRSVVPWTILDVDLIGHTAVARHKSLDVDIAKVDVEKP